MSWSSRTVSEVSAAAAGAVARCAVRRSTWALANTPSVVCSTRSAMSTDTTEEEKATVAEGAPLNDSVVCWGETRLDWALRAFLLRPSTSVNGADSSLRWAVDCAASAGAGMALGG